MPSGGKDTFEDANKQCKQTLVALNEYARQGTKRVRMHAQRRRATKVLDFVSWIHSEELAIHSAWKVMSIA